MLNEIFKRQFLEMPLIYPMTNSGFLKVVYFIYMPKIRNQLSGELAIKTTKGQMRIQPNIQQGLF
jgi:hypothetical protein